MEHRFENITSEELKKHIEKKSLVILGIGTIEEHGKHLPTGTDWFIIQRQVLLHKVLKQVQNSKQKNLLD